jgi:hypothetical protein
MDISIYMHLFLVLSVYVLKQTSLRIFYFPFFDSCFPFPILFNMKILILYFYLSVTSYTFKLPLPSVPTTVYLQLLSLSLDPVRRTAFNTSQALYP